MFFFRFLKWSSFSEVSLNIWTCPQNVDVPSDVRRSCWIRLQILTTATTSTTTKTTATTTIWFRWENKDWKSLFLINFFFVLTRIFQQLVKKSFDAPYIKSNWKSIQFCRWIFFSNNLLYHNVAVTSSNAASWTSLARS